MSWWTRVVLSGPTLAKIAPHIDECLQNIVTSHEDTELGLCIYHHAGISCTDYEVSFKKLSFKTCHEVRCYSFML